MKTQTAAFSSEIPGPDWVEERKNYISGSIAAAILGKSSYSTPLQVWLRKKGHIPPVESSDIMYFGNIFEPTMSAYFTSVTGLKTRRVNEPIEHKEYSFLRANIDRQILNGEGVDGTGVLELKTTTSHRLKSLDGEIPIEWRMQVQFYMGITSYSYAYLLVYERDSCRFHEPLLIKRDDQLIADMESKLIDWWETYMIGNKRPDPINGEDVLLLYPESRDGSVLEATPDTYTYYQELMKVREKTEDLQLEKEVIEVFLKNEMEDAERLVVAGRNLITWKYQTTNRLDTKALKQRYPALCKKFMKQTSTRRFVVK
jgi:putative phage-type endonuclease